MATIAQYHALTSPSAGWEGRSVATPEIAMAFEKLAHREGVRRKDLKALLDSDLRVIRDYLQISAMADSGTVSRAVAGALGQLIDLLTPLRPYGGKLSADESCDRYRTVVKVCFNLMKDPGFEGDDLGDRQKWLAQNWDKRLRISAATSRRYLKLACKQFEDQILSGNFTPAVAPDAAQISLVEALEDYLPSIGRTESSLAGSEAEIRLRPSSPDSQIESGMVPESVKVSEPTSRQAHSRIAVSEHLARAVDQLAAKVRSQLQLDERHRQVTEPASLDVGWANASEEVNGDWHQILRDANADPLDLAGRYDEIAGVFCRIPSRRLVILGAAGSGKSVMSKKLARLLLDSDQRVPGEAVPIVLHLANWRPHKQSLRAWIAATLAKSSLVYGDTVRQARHTAEELVDLGLVLPVLDGFDEMPESRRAKALQDLATAFGEAEGFVLVSRTDAYRDALSMTSKRLSSAAVIELQQLVGTDVVGYFTANNDDTENWAAIKPLLESENSDYQPSPVRAALSTPLMVALARRVYETREEAPVELLNESQFPTSASIETFLLSEYLTVCYETPNGATGAEAASIWTEKDAQRWLGFLAIHLYAIGRPSFLWTNLRYAVPRFVLFPLALLVLSGIFLSAPGDGPYDAFDGAGIALLFTPFFARILRDEQIPESTGLRLSVHDREGPVLRTFFRNCMGGASLGAISGLAFGFAKHHYLSRHWVVPDTLLAATVGTAIFALASFEELFAEPTPVVPAPNFITSLRSGQATAFIRLVVYLAIVFTSTSLISFIVHKHFITDRNYLFCLATLAVMATGFSSWGMWLQARVGLAIRGALPWRLVAFMEDACNKGVMQHADTGYEFRHALLLEHLALKSFNETRYTARYPGYASTSIMANIAASHASRGEYSAAEALYWKVYRKLRLRRRKNRALISRALYLLAEAQIYSGLYGRAEANLAFLVRRLRRSAGDSHYEILRARVSYALVLEQNGKNAEAKAQHSLALEHGLQAYGPESALFRAAKDGIHRLTQSSTSASEDPA